jgi:uncharacterized protein YdhG (YjbR/CyaY superfamily)
MAQTKFRDVDEYIATFPVDVRTVLESIRQTIREAAPLTEEKISYHMPTFTLYDDSLHFAVWKKHIGFYGISGALDAFKQELAPYTGPKGSLRFPLDKPMPLSLIGDVVKFEVKESFERATRKRD